MIKDLIFLFKQNCLFYHNRGNAFLLWVLLVVLLILVGAVFIANQHGLYTRNVDGLIKYTGSLVGSTND